MQLRPPIITHHPCSFCESCESLESCEEFTSPVKFPEFLELANQTSPASEALRKAVPMARSGLLLEMLRSFTAEIRRPTASDAFLEGLRMSKGSKGNRCKRFQGKHLWMMCASSMLLSLVLFEWRCRPLPKTEGLNMIGFGRTESRSFHTYEPVAKGRERDHGRPANQALFG